MAASNNKSALGLLRVLLVASVAVPAVLLLVTSWRDYNTQMARARQDLERTCEVAQENAVRVFERQRDVAEHVNDLVRDMTENDVLASQFTLHRQFAALTANIPEIQSVLLVGANGEPLVSAGLYPLPRHVSVSDRDYFRGAIAVRSGAFISSLQMGKFLKQPFFGFARTWTGPDGVAKGVIDIAVSPQYFTDFYELLLTEDGIDDHGKIMMLMRNDGQVLARYPRPRGPLPRVQSASPFAAAIARSPEGGVFKANGVTGPDPPRRIFAYRRVTGFPLYVIAGRSTSAILAVWWQIILGRLAVGVPTTFALFAITWTALVRTRREEWALAQADAEIVKREHAEQALLRAQRLEAVGQLTGGVAHDFNNLLTVIIGSIELLERRSDDATTVQRLARNIRAASERGAEITAKLLSFSRQHRVNPEVVDVNARLRAFEPLLRQAVNETITLTFELAPQVCSVSLDPGEFESAVLNLVGNARDAMPRGGRITITTRNDIIGADHAEMKPGPAVRVTVSDDGAGMDAETAARAIEPFFTTKGVGQGTGLGLSQVYGFAKQSGGDLAIETAPGVGTSIAILLPGHAGEVTIATSDAPLSVQVRPSEAVVLVVEDEPEVRAVAVEGLKAIGYRTLSAADAEAALDILRQNGRVDLLFADIVMPGARNGLQLQDEARRLRPGLKVLLTSGYSLGAGPLPAGVPVLSKPYDQTRLADQVREVLAAAG